MIQIKTFVAVIVFVGCLVGGWLILFNQSANTVDEMLYLIEHDVLVNLRDEDWEKTEDTFQNLKQEWEKNKDRYSFMLDQKSINDIDIFFARANAYIEYQETSLAIAEVYSIQAELSDLIEKEYPVLKNLF